MSDTPDLHLVGIAIGLLLIVFPEPATTATGLALTTASAGVSMTQQSTKAAGGGS